MKKKAQALLKKYEQQLSNMVWHRDTNKPWGFALDKLNERIADHEQFVRDIKAYMGVEI